VRDTNNVLNKSPPLRDFFIAWPALRPTPCLGRPYPKEAVMAKPRRKHANFKSIAQSPQGRHFLSLAQSALGADSLQYRPIESLKGGHIFLLRGPAGWAVLVDRKEKAHGNEWLHRYGILFEPPWSPISWQIDLLAYRWCPWLHAKATGDATVRDSPTTQRYRVSDALRRERTPQGPTHRARGPLRRTAAQRGGHLP